MEPSDLGFVDQILENRDLLDKLHREYGQEIPELGVLLKIQDPWELEDQVRGRIGGRDPSWYWKVVNDRYPSIPVSVDGSISDFSSTFPPRRVNDIDWKKLLEPIREDLEQKVFPAVGSLELEDDDTFIGTGWLVGEQMVITNRHVLINKHVACREDSGRIDYSRPILFDLRDGPRENEEYDKEFEVTDVLYLAPDDGPDVALLRVKNESFGGDYSLPAPLTLCQEEPTSEQIVLTVGYPGYELDDICKEYFKDNVAQIFLDSFSPDGQLNLGMFNVKRMSTGKLAEVTSSRLYHFCNTMGGSSGSAIVSLEGQVVGLHYDGDCDTQRNFAVPATVIRQIVDSHS